ncbi:cytochrome P450 [Spirillospora sp. CA-294931]|uniref:cytochrome P450 n=1 Tax=Spirillospora sp. CA-294931 TaxID=3240042 RepID=UPI003D90EDEB
MPAESASPRSEASGCPLGPPAFAARHAGAALAPITLPSGDRVRAVARHEDIRLVMSHSAASRDLRYEGAPRLTVGLSIESDPSALLNMDAPEHTRLRRILSGTFTPRRIETWRPRVREIAVELADGLDERCELVEDFAFPLPSRVICELLGVPEEDFPRFRHWTERFLSASDASADDRITAVTEFTGYAAELVAAHRAAPSGDLIDVLVAARDQDDRLSEPELVRLVFGLILAGHETTAGQISRGVLRLLDHPEHWESLVADPGLVAAAVEETLRYEGPGGEGMLRRMTEKVELSEGTIEAGEAVLLLLGAGNFDPAAYPEPERFDVGRFADGTAAAHLGFGHGPHYCLGANLARMELQEAFRALVTRVPGLRLAVPPDEVAWLADALIHRPIALPMRVQ